MHKQIQQPKDADYILEHINFEEIVPGDVVELSGGSLIPGDVRVVINTHLMVNQVGTYTVHNNIS